METETKPRPRLIAALIAAGCLAAAGASLSGCNTVEGAGEDLQEASQNVRDAFDGDDD